MRIALVSIVLGALLFVRPSPAEPTLVQRLLAGYDEVKTVSCEVRRTRKSDELTVRFLSRVHFQRPGRIHVENVSPDERYIVADGTHVYEYRRGEDAGRLEAIAEMPPARLYRLRAVPGSPMEHLLRLQEASETDLGPNAEFPVRKGYATDTRFAELNLDREGRLARIAIYTDATQKYRLAEYRYESFVRVSDTVWLARMHRGTVQTEAGVISDISRFTRFAVNEPIAGRLFDVSAVLPGIAFQQRIAPTPR